MTSSQNFDPDGLSEFDRVGMNFQQQYLKDLSVIHEQFINLWFKHIDYYESHLGQLPAENLKFIDGLNFVECCFLQQELDLMADVVAEFAGKDANRPRDMYTESFDMSAQVSAYMNYIDQRLARLHRVQGFMNQNPFSNLSIQISPEGDC